jgi:endogenous inhibitor of DNA gyrase (YacG/DUF329 family)
MGGRCPICGKPRSEKYRPFCSLRCADIDLGRWLKGEYAFPGVPELDEDEEGARPGEAGGDEAAHPSTNDSNR